MSVLPDYSVLSKEVIFNLENCQIEMYFWCLCSVICWFIGVLDFELSQFSKLFHYATIVLKIEKISRFEIKKSLQLKRSDRGPKGRGSEVF